ncbi:NAD-dependent epimerase/dehydratase family protein [Amycolatopsis thermophila]|uniref:Nucleoside-diphosphate-sugar epimerase n=1 Tax=Amycolatopsis thermophila TaxID=206084 RepID=A0ABU0F236_9PSEU|nr:NAD-dependent epimerase/dehydratase family protein [Amycolatopsis thermophila]MDQ0381650.1 nucleoside-diphosphate-sugar epimerase [Amycolatopsis thermophila]
MNSPASTGLRVVVTGASGNIGTSTVQALGRDPGVASIVGVVRREPERTPPKVRWHTADLAEDQVNHVVRGADVVIHLAWLFQPSHDPALTWRSNVLGAIRVFEAAAREQVPALVYSSSVGAYSPGPKDRPVPESWPTHGWPGAAYPREKAYLERYLDGFERANPDMRVVRLRPGFVFKREAASEQRRLFAGPFIPGSLVRPALIPVIPDVPGLRLQAVHSADIGEAFRLAALKDVHGAFNVAADPVVDAPALARLLGARTVPVPAWALRAAVAAGWYAHLLPASPGLLDTVLRLPIMDTTRARDELGWIPRHDSLQAIGEFLSGLRRGVGMDTPPLAPDDAGRRLHEVNTGIGSRP